MPQRSERRRQTAGKKTFGRKASGRRAGPGAVRVSNYQGPRAAKPQNGARGPWQSEAGPGKVRTGGPAGRAGGELSVLQKYLEPKREREREIQRKKKEIMASKARKEKNRRELKDTAITKTPRVSYVKKPFAVRSKVSMVLTVAALLLGGAGIYAAVTTRGQATLTHGAMGLCSMVLAAAAVWYGGISFLEDDKNYGLARLGILLGVVLLAGWGLVIFIGLGGLG